MAKKDWAKEWGKQRDRIRQAERRIINRGYELLRSTISRPDKITKRDVDKLKRVTTDKLYKNAKFVTENGQRISGTKRRQQERKSSAQKAANTRKISKDKSFYKEQAEYYPSITDTVLKNVEDEIRRWQPPANRSEWFQKKKEADKNLLQRILEGAIQSEGREAVAARLEANAEEVNRIVQEVLYESGGGDADRSGRSKINFDLVRFSAILMGRPLTVDESKTLTDFEESGEYEE